MTSTWAVVVAAGSGRRYGGQKQFEELRGRRVVDWSLAAAADACDGVALVVSDDALTMQFAADVVTMGGESRSASVRQGLAVLPDDADVVVVHDAARPGASAELFSRVIEQVREGADAAIPALSVPDTIKRVIETDGRRVVAETLPRDQLVAVQTPQAFRLDRLTAAHAGGGDATDDAALIESFGGTVVVVEGEAAAHKITSADDLDRVRRLLGGPT